MITNDDIKKLKTVFATKNDLKKFATKDDLKKFATKDDLKKFATKDDLGVYSTKDELRSLKNEIFDKMDEKYSQLFNLVDPLMKEIRDKEESRNIFSYRIEDHETRLKDLENKAVTA